MRRPHLPVTAFLLALLSTCAHRPARQPAAWEWDAAYFEAYSASPNYFHVTAAENSLAGDLDDFVAGLLTEKGYSRVPAIDVADFVLYYTALTDNGLTVLAVVARDNRAFKACMARPSARGACAQTSSAKVIYHAESRTAVPSPDFREGLRGLLGGIPPRGQRI